MDRVDRLPFTIPAVSNAFGAPDAPLGPPLGTLLFAALLATVRGALEAPHKVVLDARTAWPLLMAVIWLPSSTTPSH